jgi:O-antigen/teichoic acid export membrane protein
MVTWLRHRLPASRFVRRLALLSGGTVLGQGLLVVVSPLLTRLYSPADFGLLAIFSSFSAILGMVMALRYEFAIPLCDDDADAVDMVGLSAAVTILLTLLLALAVWGFAPWLALIVASPSLAPLLWLLPPAMLICGLTLPLNFWSVRQGTFRVNSASQLAQSAGQAGSQLALGVAGQGGPGLICGYCLGYLTRFGCLLWMLPSRDRALLLRPRPAGMLRLARLHWRYPVFTTASSLLNSTAQLLPAIILAALYGPIIAGLFGLGQRVVGLPVRVLSTSASQVFLAELPRCSAPEAYHLFVRTSLYFLTLGLVGMTPLALAGPEIFAFVFGGAWHEAGQIVQILTPLYLARFVVMPVSQALNVFRRQHLHLIWAAANGIVLVTSFIAGWWLHLDPLGTIALYSFGSTLVHVLYFATAWTVARAEARAARA